MSPKVKLPDDKIEPLNETPWAFEIRDGAVERFIQLPAPTREFLQQIRPHELKLLHEMVEDYSRARWFRKKLRWWAIWVLGLPAFVLTFYETLEKLWKLIFMRRH